MNRSLWSLMVAAALVTIGAGSGVAGVAAQTRATPFQVGDRILLHVEGDSALSDTFTVVAGPALRLPAIGEVSLAGVRRADLEAHLTRELGQYIKDPVVQARALIRVSVLGEVTRPGFYAVPIDLVLADALMLAGGATQEARVDRLRILRGNSALWSGNSLQTEIARGATLEDLGVRAGDRIQVPKRDPESKWRIVSIIIGSVATAVGVIALTSR
ncbi:MAG TPA: SLBB domain-containing protein [Gemmatimonadales bacterium]|jgi:protein involved in polysaccharide export with SLBB domain|nr:SLBB domain-containing protein [Gemmatimonadales bacterium]